MSEIREIIEKYALQNALKYKTVPKSDSVMRILMGNHQEFRSKEKALEIESLMGSVLAEIGKMHPDEWQKRLEVIAPELLEWLSCQGEQETKRGLPPLEEAEKGVNMRFAPNPNGAPTLGSARGIILNSEYVNIYRKYRSKFILRFDDTDPVKKSPLLEAYDWYREDCEWLGAKPDEVITASERMPLYYGIAEDLILKGGAYVCQCDQPTFKVYKDKGIACQHRDQKIEENLDLWKRMIAGDMAEGAAVLRIKTDLSARDPAIRDWPAARIISAPHPLVGSKYCVWPMLDFESAIEDHLKEITHILRGKELVESGKRQLWLYKHMGWIYPRVIYWGRLKISYFGSFSASKLRKAIEHGDYNGWADPRMPTVRAMRCRGIKGEAIRRFMLDLGVNKTDIDLNMDSLYSINRRLIDPEANRYFFVWNPVELEIKGKVPLSAKAPLHPTQNRGFREIPAGNTLFVCKNDLDRLRPGDNIRLKDLCNIQILSVKPAMARFMGIELLPKMTIVHWAPKNGIPIKVAMPDGTSNNGVGELGIAGELGKVVQFERFGFVRIHRIGDSIVAYYTHR